MVSIVSKNKENRPSPANWKNAEQDRELTVWQVALLSLGIDPSKTAESLVKNNAGLYKDYRDRYLFLGKRLRVESCVGYVLWLKEHPYNQRSKTTKNFMVDVVSCITVLLECKRFELAREFTTLREPLAQRVLYVPGHPAPDVYIGSKNIKVIEASIKAGRDTSQSVEERLSAQRALQIFAVVVDAYGLKPHAPATEMIKRLDEIIEGLAADGFIGNGLGRDAFKKSFIEGRAIAIKRGLKFSD